MVKNSRGGNKAKKQKRNRDTKQRINIKNLLKEEGQEYAFVSDLKGDCRMALICWDKKERIGIIRGKMRKRVWISRGDLVLVGIREFQDDKCDIIQKYDSEQAKLLAKKGHITQSFIKDGSTFTDIGAYDDDSDDEPTIAGVNDTKQEEINIDDFNFDDI